MRKILICLAVMTGCRSFDVRVFDVPVTREAPRLTAATSDGEEIEPWGAVVAAAIIVGFGVLYYAFGSS